MSNETEKSCPSTGGRWFPGQPLTALRQEIDHLLERFGAGRTLPNWLTESGPALDVSETEEAIVILMDAPGWSREEIHVELLGQQVTIHGTPREDAGPSAGIAGAKVIRAERRREPFTRTVPLPCQVNEDRGEAVLREGILQLTFPKSSLSRSHTIPVRTGPDLPPEPAAG